MVRRVGGRNARPIDVRFVSATNRDLENAVASRSFREDLYYRLNGVLLRVPPLRSRPGEIESLTTAFIASSCKQLRRPNLPALSPLTRSILASHSWPGNIRELKNVIDRAVVMCSGDAILPEHLPPQLREGPQLAMDAPEEQPPGRADDAMIRLRSEMEALERKRIGEALEKCGGNQTKAADLLGISRRTLVARLTEHGFPRPRKT
jgi:two-component system response regulator AtoC